MEPIVVRDHHGVLSTVEMLQYTAARQPDDVALRIWRNNRYEETTFREFAQKVDLFAAGLMRAGIEPKDKVSVLGENRPEWAIAYLAVHRAGAIVVPLDSLLKATEFRHIIGDSGARMVICSGKFLSDILEVRDALGNDMPVVCMDDEKCGERNVQCMSSLMEGPLPTAWPSVTLEDLAAIIYTSGTTGQSKGVMLSQRNLASDTAYASQVIIYGPGDNFLSVLPLHHTFECTGGFLVPLYQGATITYARSLKSRDLIEDIRNTKATLLLGVPLLWEKMMEGIQRKLGQAPPAKRIIVNALFALERFGRKLGLTLGPTLFHSLREKAGMSSLRIMVSGGAALAPHVAEFFSSLGFTMIQGYGLTETSPITNVTRLDHINHASVGPVIPGAEIRIDRPGPGGHGEICIRGPMIMVGYYKNEEATRASIDPDGWLHTGDIGTLDEFGRLFISGRMKNVIVTASGKNVYPEEVEHHINQSPWVLESLVIGRPIPGVTSEEVHAMVVPNYEYFEEQKQLRGEPYTAEEIERIVLQEVRAAVAQIGEYKRPRSFELRTEEFEKTSTKKIKRYLYMMRDIPVGAEAAKAKAR